MRSDWQGNYMSTSHLSLVPNTGAPFETALAKGQLKLPLLPRVAAMVIQLATDENANAQQLAQLIQGDPALAGHVMRLANSPAYRPATPFVSLQQAIARLGMNSISEIALATSLNASLFKVPGYEALLQRYWRQSLLVSAWSREIARLRTTNVEASFIAGLLCFIGRPVVLQGVCQLGLTPDAIEDFVENYYVRAGLSLVASWSLPAVVGVAIEHHQKSAYSAEYADEVLNVKAASQLVEAEQDLTQWSAELLGELNFYPQDLEKLEAKVPVIDTWIDAVCS
jgi:HD-like signal output (HDOD) protein